jgi:hypothetical protein
MDSIREFKSSIKSWRSATIVVIDIGVKGVGDSKGEKKLLMEKVNWTKMFLFLVIISKQNMNFFRHTMETIVQWF